MRPSSRNPTTAAGQSHSGGREEAVTVFAGPADGSVSLNVIKPSHAGSVRGIADAASDRAPTAGGGASVVG